MTPSIQTLLALADKLQGVSQIQVTSDHPVLTAPIILDILVALRKAAKDIHLLTSQSPSPAADASSPSTTEPTKPETAQNNRSQEAILSMDGIVSLSDHRLDTAGMYASSVATAPAGPAKAKRSKRARQFPRRAGSPRTKDGPGALPPAPPSIPESGPA